MPTPQQGYAKLYRMKRTDTPFLVVYRDPLQQEKSGRSKRVQCWFANEGEAEKYRDVINEQLLTEGTAGLAFHANVRADAVAARRHLDGKGHSLTSLLELAQRYTEKVTANAEAALAIDVQREAFLEEMRNIERAAFETVKNLEVRVNLWIRLAQLSKVGDITREAAEVLRHRPVHPQTRRNDIAAASAFCSWLVERRRLDANPFVGMRRPKVHRSAPVVWEAEELERLLQVARKYQAGRWLAALVVMNYVGGARPSELAQVRLFYGRHPHARIEGGKLRGRANRSVPLLPVAVAWLKEAGKPATVPKLTREARRPICDKARVKWRTDICRHTYISNRIALVKNDGLVALEAGTSEDVIHRVYHHVRMPDEARKWEGLRPKRR